MKFLSFNFRRMLDASFLKPFLLLNLMMNVGLEWGGFPALGNYQLFNNICND